MSAASTQQPDANPFHYTHIENFAAILEGLNATLFVSTYQAGKLVVVRSLGGRVSTLLRTFEQAMGLAVDPHRHSMADLEFLERYRHCSANQAGRPARCLLHPAFLARYR